MWFLWVIQREIFYIPDVSVGPYIVDFYCHSARLAIELDGSRHYEDQGKAADRRRDLYLEQVHHLRLLRFSNLDIAQRFEGVCALIRQEAERSAPSSVPFGATLPLTGGRLAGGHMGSPLRRILRRERWIGQVRRGSGTAPALIFHPPRAQWPGGNLECHSDFARRK